MFEELKTKKRLLFEADLSPIQGDRFQPTGFADLGAATYQLADSTQMLLVESAQSVANRLEATIIGPDNELVPELEGLSYIRVQMEGDSDSKTNSLIEAHRINSPFIISDKDFQESFTAESGYAKGKAINWGKAAATLFKFDINSLVHGAFMANLGDGRMRFARALSGFIEAKNVNEVVSGGVKNNPIDPTGKLRAKSYDKDVYSNVPYQRSEYIADKITAYFNLDLGLLESYQLGDDAFDLLVALSLLKITRFLDSSLRLRTACDFKVNSFVCTSFDSFQIPDEQQLLKFIKEKIAAVKNQFADPVIREINTVVVKKVEKEKK